MQGPSFSGPVLPYMRKFRIVVFFVLLAICGSVVSVSAQQLPLAGTRFSFAIIEGPDSLGSTQEQLTSDLILSVVSDSSGCGIIFSPSGYQQNFSFNSRSVTTVYLDHSLMLLSDDGKSNKAILISTSQPVTMNLHDYAPAAGDATQLLPDNALDTSYIVASWGIFNDIQEDNHTEFVVTATSNNTSVTITPTVKTLLGQPAGQPFTITLDRGECYIVKADARSFPANTSLVESRISSDKPVSVVTGLTCAYNPLGVESCNELMDELIPRSAWGTDFNVRTLSPFNDEDIIFITSDVKNYSVVVTGGITYFTNNGHLSIPITQPEHFIASVPVQCHELTEGSNTVFTGESDPSMVTILPIQQYRDTLLWATPDLPDVRMMPAFLDHYITLVYPTAVQSQVLLDGTPITNLGQIDLVPRTTFSSAAIGILPGRHTLTSPQPIFGVATGFSTADAYTLVAGSVAAAVSNTVKKIDSRIVPVDSEIFCREFSVSLMTDSTLSAGDDISTLSLRIGYDAANLQLRRVTLAGSITNGNTVVVDSSVLGLITITVTIAPEATILILPGELCSVTFTAIDPQRTPTTIYDTCISTSIFACLQPDSTEDALRIAPIAKIDTLHVGLTIDAGSATLGNLDTATISISALSRTTAVKSFSLLLDYNHDILSYGSYEIIGTQVGSWNVVRDSVDTHTDRFTFSTITDSLEGPGALLRVFFKSKVSDSATALIKVSSTLTNTRWCPLSVSTPDAEGLFLGKDLCGDPEIHAAILRTAMTLSSIIPNPAKNSFYINVMSPMEQDARLDIIDILGRTVWSNPSIHLGLGSQKLTISSTELTSGRYIVRLQSQFGSQSRLLEIAR